MQSQGKSKNAKNNTIGALCDKGYRVKVLHRGNKKVIHADGVAMKDYEDMPQGQENLHIWRQVHTAIFKTMPDHPDWWIPQPSAYSTSKPLRFKDRITYVDIKHCYLQVANRLGYINDKDYERILSRYSKTKIQVCAAITSLFREIKSEYYDSKGRVTHTITCDNYYLESAQNNIINYSRQIMSDYCKSGMDYYFRNVDGIVVPYRDRDFILGYIKSTGLLYKEISGVFYGNGMVLNELTNELEDCL